ncbi:hypothetical protein GQ44DRAFT_706472 [Phaeosphaeriaceae sp. PMI808]|nr:hypothetical protein GQ44DRAFT_706472 [Phaeosphaeriaceae sp. PMI808]
MQDADIEDDMDDDMMDKISSSPSIDDGRYSFPLQPPVWPQRRESLTPQSSPVRSDIASSPFTTTPIHFPISGDSASRPSNASAPDQKHVLTLSRQSPIPISLPSSQKNKNTKSAEHHHGEYSWTMATSDTEDNTKPRLYVTLSPRSKQRKYIERRLQMHGMREDSQASLISDLDEDKASIMLQPLQLPVTNSLEDPFSPRPSPRTTNGTPPPAKHPDGDDDSWTTDSDADSWDEDMDNDDDASNDVSFSDEPRFIDSGWGGECLREPEDIDFEFVYALHTFVATVEGQANATKGDTMVLLDDSNSYWWLVRVVKDSSIGYLPAEHIETPTERLARLNKHRNIDLSATMLGDTAEKSKNPLKKAMRRRNAKTVQFAPPTYVEASDYDYSSDEDGAELFGGPDPKQVQQQQQENQEDAQNTESETQEDLNVQPLKVGGKKDPKEQAEGAVRSSDEEARKNDETQRGSDEGVERPLDPKVTKNGTLRNTDSFFKDETTETRKITLTPNILRDDSSTSTTGSRERGASLESLEKNGFADKVKDDKKKKEKKAGMLSGLFKRKDKKAKGQLDLNDSDVEKVSEEVDRSSPQSKPSDELAERSSAEQAGVQRQPSKGKLQKSPRSRDDSPQKTKGILKSESPTEATAQAATTDGSKPSGPQATMRLVPLEQDDSGRVSVEGKPVASKNPFSTKQSQQTQDPNVKPEQVKQAKNRVQLDDFDSDEDSDPFADPDAQAKSSQQNTSDTTGRLSESPVHVSAADAQPAGRPVAQDREREPDPQQPPGLTLDSSSQETSSPISTPTPDDSPMKPIPENVPVTTFRSENTSSPTHTTTTPAIIPPHPASHPPPPPNPTPPNPPPILLRHHTTPRLVRRRTPRIPRRRHRFPVGRDHPIMSTLFVEESKTVQGLSLQLDTLLTGLMEKRMRRGAGKGEGRSVGGGR